MNSMSKSNLEAFAQSNLKARGPSKLQFFLYYAIDSASIYDTDPKKIKIWVYQRYSTESNIAVQLSYSQQPTSHPTFPGYDKVSFFDGEIQIDSYEMNVFYSTLIGDYNIGENPNPTESSIQITPNEFLTNQFGFNGSLYSTPLSDDYEICWNGTVGSPPVSPEVKYVSITITLLPSNNDNLQTDTIPFRTLNNEIFTYTLFGVIFRTLFAVRGNYIRGFNNETASNMPFLVPSISCYSGFFFDAPVEEHFDYACYDIGRFRYPKSREWSTKTTVTFEPVSFSEVSFGPAKGPRFFKTAKHNATTVPCGFYNNIGNFTLYANETYPMVFHQIITLSIAYSDIGSYYSGGLAEGYQGYFLNGTVPGSISSEIRDSAKSRQNSTIPGRVDPLVAQIAARLKDFTGPGYPPGIENVFSGNEYVYE